MTGEGRADHVDYVVAVVGEMEALGIESDGLVDIASGQSRRATAISLTLSDLGSRFDETVYLDVEWDEERGWTLHNTFLPGGVRGYAHGCYGLDLGLVPEPAEVARRVERALDTGLLSVHFGSGWPERRSAADHDPGFEAALAAFPPTGPRRRWANGRGTSYPCPQ